MKQSIEYIESVICAEEKIDPCILHTKTRERTSTDIRQIIMYFALKMGCTQYSTGCYFGRDHATALHARQAVRDMYDTDKKYREKIDHYDSLLREGMAYRIAHYTEILARLKKETMELYNELMKL